MASAYLPVLLVSVSTNAVPDDSALVTLPRGQVDYLSHEWQEEDVWRSWRNMTRQKNEIANGARLENASWRTWWKQRNKLKTVSPETLNWLKDSDVTWLYGPLHTAVEWTPPPKPAAVPDSVDAPTNADAHSRLHLARPRARPSAPVTKPILKHRSISELLTSDFPNPTSPIFSPPESDDEHDSIGSPDAAGTGTHAAKLAAQLSAKRPPLPHTKSDTHIIRWGASRAFRPSSPPRIDPPGHAPAGTDSAAGSTTANPPKKKHISFNTFVEQCIAIEKPKKNASGFFNVGMDPMGAWNQGAGFVDDDGYDEDQEDEDLDEEDEDEGWDGSGVRAIRSDSDEGSDSNPEEDEPGGQRAIGVIQEDDEDDDEEDDDDDDVLQMRTPRSHSSMSNTTVTLAGTGALDPATSSTLTASNATPRTTKKQPRSQSVSTASSSSSSTSATTTTSGPSAASTSASSPASSLSPARREGSTRRKGSLSPGTDSAKNGEGEVPPAAAAGRPRHRRRTAVQPTAAVGMSRTRSSSSSHSRGGHVTIAPIAPTMLKTGGAWEESFGDEGGSDDGLGYGYTYSQGAGSVLDGRWSWNEGRGKRTSSGGGVKKSGNTRYPQREKTGEEGEGTHDADAVANTRANAVSPRPKTTKERENYRAEKATPVELVYAPPKGSGYAAYGYGQGGLYGGYGPNSNGTPTDLRNNVDNNSISNATANWTPGPSAYAEGSMADGGAAYGYAPGARGGGMGVYAGYGRTTLGGYSGKNGFSDEGAEEERVEVVEDNGDGPVVSAGTSSAQTTTPPIGIPISQPAHTGDDGFLLGSAPRTSGAGMEALERSRGRGGRQDYFAYPYAHAASYQPTTVGQQEHVRQQHAAETLLQQRLLARQPTPYVDEEDATDFFGAGADYFYARRGGRGYEPASARSGFMDEDGQIEDVRGADPVRGAQDELHARERGGYLVPPTATRGKADEERPSRSRSRSHSRTPSPAFLAANTAVNPTPSGHPGAAAAPSAAPAIPPSTTATTGRRRSASASNPSTPGSWMSAAAALPTPEHLLALQSPSSLLAQARPSTGRTSSQNASGQGQQRAEPQRASPPQQPQVQQQGERRGRSSTRTPSASSSSWERERGTSIGSSPIGSLSPDTGARAAPIEAVLGGSAGALAGGMRDRREDGERGRERGRERRGRDRTSGKVLGASIAANPPPVGLGLVNAEGDGEVESSCGSSVAGDAQSTSTAQSVSATDSSSSAGNPTVVDASVYAPSSGSSSATITGQTQQRPATPTLAIPGRFPADEAEVAHVDVPQARENPAAVELRYLRRAEEEQRRRVHPTPSNSPVVEVRRMAPVQRTSTASSSSGSGGTTPTSTTPNPSPSATTPRGLSPSTKTKQLRPPPLVPSPPVPAKPSTSFTAVSSPRRAVAPTLPNVNGVTGPASPVAAPVPTHAPAAETIVAKAVDIMSSAGAYLRLWGHNDAA